MDLMNVMSLLLSTQQVTLGKETSSNSIRLDLSDVAWLGNVETLPLAWVFISCGIESGRLAAGTGDQTSKAVLWGVWVGDEQPRALDLPGCLHLVFRFLLVATPASGLQLFEV